MGEESRKRGSSIGRREEDKLAREKIDSQERDLVEIKLHASRLMRAWLILLTCAVGGALVFNLRLGSALNFLHSAQRSLDSVQHRQDAEFLGLCRAVNSNRSYVDDAHRHISRIFLLEGQLQYNDIGRQLKEGISSGVRSAGNAQVRLGLLIFQGGASIKVVSAIDCHALEQHPLKYQTPQPTPIGAGKLKP